MAATRLFKIGDGDDGPDSVKQDDRSIASFNPEAISDIAAEIDDIGFAPYAKAIATFLLHDKTQPPLTVSVEGKWGSGKSSIMLQITRHLKRMSAERGQPRPFMVWFNPWRCDKDEALWAAFALTVARQLGRQISFWSRLRAHALLAWRRLDWIRGRYQIFQLGGFALATIVFFVVALTVPPSTRHPLAIGGFTTAAAALALACGKAKRVFGNPLSGDLRRIMRDPHYDEKIAYIENFQEDFTRIVDSYVGECKVYVFIDDLDRCEVPRAAELMSAINLLMSATQPLPGPRGISGDRPPAKLFFLLGLDRLVVAAGIAAKNKSILPYLTIPGRAMEKLDPEHKRLAALDYGYDFLEKFIQVPFRVPAIESSVAEQWAARLLSERKSFQDGPEDSSRVEDAMEKPVELGVGADPQGFAEVVATVSGVLGLNPRKIKQFINVFRLQTLIAIGTGLLVPKSDEPYGNPADPSNGVLGIEQLGVLTGLLLRWPRLTADLIDDPRLLTTLINYTWSGEDIRTSTHSIMTWKDNEALRNALHLPDPYSLRDVDIRPVLSVLPSAFGRQFSMSERAGRPSRLVPVEPIGPNIGHSSANTAEEWRGVQSPSA